VSDYDPDADPRYIPDPFAEMTARLLDAAKLQAIEDYEAAVDRIDAIQQMFETEGWAILVNMIARESDTLDMGLTKEMDRSQWMMLRGQKVQADFFLELPGRLSQERQRAMSMIHDLTSTEGSEDGR
jgi:hypothetical protein